MRARRRLLCTCGGDIVGPPRAIVNISTALLMGMEVDSRHGWRTRVRARITIESERRSSLQSTQDEHT